MNSVLKASHADPSNQGARKKDRHQQNKQGDFEQSLIVRDVVGMCRREQRASCSTATVEPLTTYVTEPFGLHSFGPQNSADENGSYAMDSDQLPSGGQDYSFMLHEPLPPGYLSKPPAPLDVTWPALPEPISMPPSQHYSYQHSAYQNIFQPTLLSNGNYAINASDPEPVPKASELPTPCSSGSSVSRPITQAEKPH